MDALLVGWSPLILTTLLAFACLASLTAWAQGALVLYKALLVRQIQLCACNELADRVGSVVAVLGNVTSRELGGTTVQKTVYSRAIEDKECPLLDPFTVYPVEMLRIKDEERLVPFDLQDNSGSVRVDPATLERDFIGAPKISERDRDDVRTQIKNWTISGGDTVYVLGRVIVRHSRIVLVAPHSRWFPLILTQYSRTELFQKLLWPGVITLSSGVFGTIVTVLMVMHLIQ